MVNGDIEEKKLVYRYTGSIASRHISTLGFHLYLVSLVYDCLSNKRLPDWNLITSFGYMTSLFVILFFWVFGFFYCPDKHFYMLKRGINEHLVNHVTLPSILIGTIGFYYVRSYSKVFTDPLSQIPYHLNFLTLLDVLLIVLLPWIIFRLTRSFVKGIRGTEVLHDEIHSEVIRDSEYIKLGLSPDL